MIASTPFAVRVGSVLLRVTGRVAGALTLTFVVLGVIGLLSFETVDEMVCDYSERETCGGPEWVSYAVLIGAVACLVIALLLLPLWLVHVAERRRQRRCEGLQTPRLHSLDGWLMAGQVLPGRHADLKERLRTLLAHAHATQVARHASAALAAFSVATLLLGTAGATIAGVVVADDNWCDQKPGDCGRATALAAAGWALVIGGTIGFILGMAGGVAARRGECQAWDVFERDWDATLHEGRTAPARVRGRSVVATR